MNNSFFLTPQIANLMEDFVREIGRGSSLFLLYGEEGVGKSRLLSKLKADRLADKKVSSIDFDSESKSVSAEDVKKAAVEASEADVIIFDHFDSASKKAQQQIIDSWATDGQDKNLNIIVCANSAGFKRFRHLAQQFQVEAKSFQLLPCDQAVSQAYLQHLLYPDHPFATLVLPASVKRLLRQSNGLFYRINEIADHHSGVIEIKHEAESVSRTLPFVIIISLFTVIAGAAYFIHSTRSLPAIEAVDVQSQMDSNSTQPEPDSAPVAETNSKPRPEPKPVPKAEPETDPAPAIETEADPERESQAKLEAEPSLSAAPEFEKNWFDQRLKYSRDWALNNDSGRGTIQIMSIEVSRFNAGNFQAYLDRLTVQGLDISQLLIFETQLSGRAFYSIMYGDYKDRPEASKQISLLPKILRTEKPIARSAGSIVRGMPGFSDN